MRAPCCPLREIIDALGPFGHLAVTALEITTEENADGENEVAVRVSIVPEAQASPAQALAAVELFQRLKRVADLGTIRALAVEYDIDAAALEALLPKEG